MLFDLHTHCKIKEFDGIVNCTFDDDFSLFPRFSLGIHPWDVDEHWEEKFAMFVGLLKNPPVGSFHDRLCAIGEIGMDKLRGGDMKIQEICFMNQLTLADSYQLPVIIHAVKTINEVVTCLSRFQLSKQVVFHGFRGKPEQTAFLLSKGYYLSFGPKFNPESLRLAYQSDRMFLETDDSGMSIADVYSLAANSLSISPTDISVPGIFTS